MLAEHVKKALESHGGVIIEIGSQGNSESFKKDNSCLATEMLGSVKPERSPEESGDEDRDSGLFSCPEPGCVKQYITMGKLKKHIASEKHAFQDVSEPLGDKVMKRWAEQFEQGLNRESFIPTGKQTFFTPSRRRPQRDYPPGSSERQGFEGTQAEDTFSR